MAQFEGYERRESKILGVLANYGISSIDECKEICDKYGVDAYNIVQETQPICFENAKWAYTVGCAIAIKEAERTGDKSAATAAANIGIGLQSFCRMTEGRCRCWRQLLQRTCRRCAQLP